ncbi:hypothetical protein K470DRAFT_258213 [Piedraia hortae CBS 480.64]|uniref:HIG1 domain-containing protein n=1 Tax=Piedraia hortae CBS 480.64 TaxID=1314780 RepID=A0A6A7BYF1_9PEZI|nr:hypothetical protein K470DRAFT_258213 [Piedraia hortae CBS 480.64]
MRTRGSLTKDEELNEAAWIAVRGATVGALKWGALCAGVAVIAQAASPVYRGLTVQFKTFLQLSGMVVGGSISAERNLHWHAVNQRRKKQAAVESEALLRYHDDYINKAADVRLQSQKNSKS